MKMTRLSLLIFFLLVGRAWAGERVLMLGLTSPEPLSPELNESFRNNVVRGIEGVGVEVVPAEEIRTIYTQRPDLAKCASVACLTELGALTRASRVVEGSVARQDNNYRFSLRLLDLPGGGLTTREEACQICTLHEAEEALGLAVSSLLGVATSPEATQNRVRLYVTSPREKLSIFLRKQEKPLGTTPAMLDLSPGRYYFSFEQPGYKPKRLSLSLKAGENLALSPELEPGTDWRRPVSKIGLGAGVAGVLAGGVLIALATDENAARRAAGVALLGVGVAGGVSGLVLWKRMRQHY